MRSPRAVLLLLPLAIAACGGGDDVDAGPPVDEITITSTKTEFDVEAFAVRAGEEVAVTYDNRHGGVPHNVHFELGGDDDPATETAPGPDEQTITFTAPDEPGEFDYICDVHPAQMEGTLVVVSEEGSG